MAYIESILLGASLAAIPGPIFFEVLRRSLTGGFRSSMILALGVFLADFAMLMLVFLGVYRFLLYPAAKIILFFAGGAVLIWMGAAAARAKKEDIEKTLQGDNLKRNALSAGFIMSVASPLSIAVWASIGGAYLIRYASESVAFINAVLIAFGGMLFFSAMSFVIHSARSRIPAKYILSVSKIFGIVLVGYGAYFLYQLVLLI